MRDNHLWWSIQRVASDPYKVLPGRDVLLENVQEGPLAAYDIGLSANGSLCVLLRQIDSLQIVLVMRIHTIYASALGWNLARDRRSSKPSTARDCSQPHHLTLPFHIYRLTAAYLQISVVAVLTGSADATDWYWSATNQTILLKHDMLPMKSKIKRR